MVTSTVDITLLDFMSKAVETGPQIREAESILARFELPLLTVIRLGGCLCIHDRATPRVLLWRLHVDVLRAIHTRRGLVS
jgi:hypothetical protein